MRLSDDGESVLCEHPAGCDESYPNHKFGAIRAQAAGWFASRAEGKAYCPAHVPGWVTSWRAHRLNRGADA